MRLDDSASKWKPSGILPGEGGPQNHFFLPYQACGIINEQTSTMKKIVYEFIFVLIFSIIGFFILIGFHDLLVMLGIKHDWSGTERVGLWGFLLGLPIGSASGVLVIDYFYFRTDGWKIFGLICALILGTFGCLIGIVLHDYFKLGQLYWIVTPLLNTLFSIIGYKFGMLLR